MSTIGVISVIVIGACAAMWIKTFQIALGVPKEEHIFAKQPSRKPCSPTNQGGRHSTVITGLGGMGDAELCLRCGKEGYFDFDSIGTYDERRHVVAPDDWPAIEEARNLPFGINKR